MAPGRGTVRGEVAPRRSGPGREGRSRKRSGPGRDGSGKRIGPGRGSPGYWNGPGKRNGPERDGSGKRSGPGREGQLGKRSGPGREGRSRKGGEDRRGKRRPSDGRGICARLPCVQEGTCARLPYDREASVRVCRAFKRPLALERQLHAFAVRSRGPLRSRGTLHSGGPCARLPSVRRAAIGKPSSRTRHPPETGRAVTVGVAGWRIKSRTGYRWLCIGNPFLVFG